jgi:hypothetical protein
MDKILSILNSAVGVGEVVASLKKAFGEDISTDELTKAMSPESFDVGAILTILSVLRSSNREVDFHSLVVEVRKLCPSKLLSTLNRGIVDLMQTPLYVTEKLGDRTSNTINGEVITDHLAWERKREIQIGYLRDLKYAFGSLDQAKDVLIALNGVELESFDLFKKDVVR